MTKFLRWKLSTINIVNPCDNTYYLACYEFVQSLIQSHHLRFSQSPSHLFSQYTRLFRLISGVFSRSGLDNLNGNFLISIFIQRRSERKLQETALRKKCESMTFIVESKNQGDSSFESVIILLSSYVFILATRSFRILKNSLMQALYIDYV